MFHSKHCYYQRKGFFCLSQQRAGDNYYCVTHRRHSRQLCQRTHPFYSTLSSWLRSPLGDVLPRKKSNTPEVTPNYSFALPSLPPESGRDLSQMHTRSCPTNGAPEYSRYGCEIGRAAITTGGLYLSPIAVATNWLRRNCDCRSMITMKRLRKCGFVCSWVHAPCRRRVKLWHNLKSKNL